MLRVARIESSTGFYHIITRGINQLNGSSHSPLIERRPEICNKHHEENRY